MSFDFDQFEEDAAIFEYERGMSRFGAEMKAAQRQGVQRWEAMKCEQRMKYFGEREFLSGRNPALNEQPARSAARTGKRNAIPAYPSRSSQTASSGVAGIAT